MATQAFQPDQTQAPYMIWGRLGQGQLQTDSMFVSDDSDNIIDLLEARRARGEVLGPFHFGPWTDRTAFKENYARWLQDSLFDSLPARMRRHESYKAIVGQGDRVVPLIASELRREPSFMFLALEEITGHDPVPEEAEGDLVATVAAWLTWLRK